MGDAKSGPVRLSFNSQLRAEFRGSTVTSDVVPRNQAWVVRLFNKEH